LRDNHNREDPITEVQLLKQPTAIDKLNERFQIPGIAKIVAGHGDLSKMQITTPAASADIYLHGAQLTSWKPANYEEVIFLSEHSHWEDRRAIRGGIPVCFPWFRAKADNPQAPTHGFVRTKAWDLESLLYEDGRATVILATGSDESSRRWWPHEFRIAHRITVGKELSLELTVTNIGSTSLKFEEALHTYHRVAAVENIRIAGLDQVSFLDNTDANRVKTQSGDVVVTGPLDSAYLHTETPLQLTDPLLKRRIQVGKKNSLSTVVWNPWKEGAKSLADLGDDEWQQMVCIEASNILSCAVTLDPGEEHIMTANMSLLEGVK
jgi:glucose-6-phosphate 1-epimerase